tara:strand:+ start:1708 stop:2079 length:372 start_codon:yes stop_codon:yes gene_type:complete
MKINKKYLAGSKNPKRRAQLIKRIANIYKKGKPYPKNLDALMKERDSLEEGGKIKEYKKGGGMSGLSAAQKQVYRRGLAAYMSSGNRPKVSQHAWAMARVKSDFGKREAARIRAGKGKKKKKN